MSLGLMAVGGLLSANAASKTKKELRNIADTPGLNLGEAIAESKKYSGDTRALESSRNTFNRAELDRLLESSIPGYAAGQKQRTGNAMSLMRGELPPDVEAAIYRSGAGRALEGGYGGSAAGRNLVARDLGRTSLDLMQLGGRNFESILGSTPQSGIANYDISPQDVIGLRGNERSERIGLRTNAATAPGKTAVWGQTTTQMGKSLMELAGSVAGSAGGAAMCAVAKLCIPGEWEAFYFWKELLAPDWFRQAYNTHAPAVAAWLEKRPVARRLVTGWMKSVLRNLF
jgi:hypothetical protein